MKIVLALLLMGLVALAGFGSISHSITSTNYVPTSQMWRSEVVDSAGGSTSLALDSEGRPHVSYYDGTNGDLKYARWDGLNWTCETVDSTGDVGPFSSIALDSNDNPHVSYCDYTQGNLKYAKWNGSAWKFDVVDSSGNVGWYTSIALDASDKPYVSYYDVTNGDLKFARWTGSSWNNNTIDSAGNVGSDTSIALDSKGNPHISYRNSTGGDLKYAKWDGWGWICETLDTGEMTDVGYWNSIALDASDKPRISYYDYTNGDLKYAKWTGSAWSFDVVESAGNVGGCTSLALDSNGSPHIGYYDGTNGDLKYARWDGLNWTCETVDSTGDVGYFTSLVLDPKDNPHISYLDLTNAHLKYARRSGDFNISISPLSQTVAIGGSTVHAVTVTQISGPPEAVTFSLKRISPPGSPFALIWFTPESGTPNFTSTLTISILSTALPGTYVLNVTATGMGTTKWTVLIVTVTQLGLTLYLNPETVSRGSSLTVSGHLMPGIATTIGLYYRFPHEAGTWKLATTMNTNSTGFYSIKAAVPTTLAPGDYDLIAVWFSVATGTYADSPITLLTIT